jgi:hypothetical protein
MTTHFWRNLFLIFFATSSLLVLNLSQNLNKGCLANKVLDIIDNLKDISGECHSNEKVELHDLLKNILKIDNKTDEKPTGDITLKELDPEMADLISQEEYRQFSGLELIASENYVSKAVLEAAGSILTNKYSEGEVGNRHYGGNEIIDKVESLCIKRALEAFKLDDTKWGVNVQPYSGSPANLEAYFALLNPGEKIMGLDMPAGGHISHGYQEGRKKMSFSSLLFQAQSYKVNNNLIILI